MNEKYKNVLVTGGCGRLGRQVYYELRNEYNITLFDRVAPDKQPFPWKPERDCKFVMGELTSLEDCMRAIILSKADCILHLAAITHATEVGRRVYQREPEDLCWNVNMDGTYYLLDAARRLGVKKIIHCSSYYATGINHSGSGMPWEIPSLPVDEGQLCQPQDTYSLSKCLNEKMLECYGNAYGFRTVAFRLLGISNPYVPKPVNVDVPVTDLNKDGFHDDTYQYVDSRDIAYAMHLALDKDMEKQHEVFNLATAKRYPESTAEFAAKHWPTIAEACKNIPEYQGGKEDVGLFTITKARKMLGYEPKCRWEGSSYYPGYAPGDRKDDGTIFE
ncbi:MAG: NAD(P)-dependent oxidoreductase [Oscillospiraceae bacterium]|nr:NAD(P)-dependent oxidoreductase [Oscillospiraceae bacterium]